MTSRRAALAALFLALALPSMTLAGMPGGIGVMGDSISDEYQFYPPHRNAARSWVEILAATRGLDFGRFDPEGRGEPRNRGFEFNWARSGATTDDLIAAGQHTGLASQVAEGRVGLVLIFIGGNDFIGALGSPDPEAPAKTSARALANVRTALGTILGASPAVRVVLATVPDLRQLPEFAEPIRDGRLPRAWADACAAALGRFNAQLRSLAAGNPRVALLDLELVTRLGALVSRDRVPFAGRWLDRARPGDDLDRFFLADGRHPGTLAQGLMARMVVDLLNARFEAGITPLTDAEILQAAQSLAPPASESKLLAEMDAKSAEAPASAPPNR